MRKGIVLKLFILTTMLCMLILSTIFIGQTIFFKQYYANRKVNDIKTKLNSFEKSYVNSQGNIKTIQNLEEDFSRESNTQVTTLDSNGNLKHAHDFYFEVTLNPYHQKQFEQKTINIPLYYLIDIEEIESKKLAYIEGAQIYISGIKSNTAFIPYFLSLENKNVTWSNKTLNQKLNEVEPKAREERKMAGKDPSIYLAGSITKVQLPDVKRAVNPIYKTNLFLESIKEFQKDLLLNESGNNYNSLQAIDYEKNNIKYKLLIKPITEKDGSLTYIFAMTSLQPVDEAVQMVKDYYVYIIAFVLVLIVLTSFYYSKQITKPLLRINHTTKKIAHLDFSEELPLTSNDEIGDLSKNINTLSNTLHSHIEKLKQDIEKEKQLESTRKEFISGVSHELKTPLSIMKSCISILKDGVAEHKKEYYFQAMEKEVDKMNILIEDMLELAKFESGTYKLEMNTFYIDELIEDVCKQLLLEIEKKEHHVTKNLFPSEVVANQNRIEQVIVNFITNAIRYTPTNEKIIISIMEESNQVKVCVENKGTHINEEQLDKIWDRFYRIDAARQRSKGGTGLGLAISKNILELHNVQYGVSNTEDGVLFFFYLNKV